MNATLVACEVVDSKLSSAPGFLLKVDIEKAYDHGNWAFLFMVVGKIGFSKR